jgi:hypothetical protein
MVRIGHRRFDKLSRDRGLGGSKDYTGLLFPLGLGLPGHGSATGIPLSLWAFSRFWVRSGQAQVAQMFWVPQPEWHSGGALAMTLTAGDRTAVGEVGEVANLGTCHFGEPTLIRLLVRLGAESHSPVARSDKPKGTSAVIALVPGHRLLLNSATEQVGCRPFGSRSPGTVTR